MIQKQWKAICLSLAFILCGSAKADKFALFPFCPQNTWMQSERLNGLHLVFLNAASQVKEKKTDFIFQENSSGNCELKKFRTIAASVNSDEFLDASYLISGDSVELRIRLVYTRYVDKVTILAPIKGTLKNLNDCILGTFQKVFAELNVIPSEKDWLEITKIVKADAAKYTKVEENISVEKVNHFLDGKNAFELENFELAKSLLEKVRADDPNYKESQFMLGNSHLFFDDFNKAYTCFKKCKDLGFEDKSLDDYLQASALLTKPAIWFHSAIRRKTWWNGLNVEENKQIISLLNALKINGKSFDETYSFDDNDISKLFKTTILPFKNMKIPNFIAFKYFTNVDVIILENSKLISDEGIQNFYKLKIIRSDVKLEQPQIVYLSGMKKITIINTKN